MKTLSLHARLTVTYLAVLLVGMLAAGFMAWQTVEQAYVEGQRANLLAQAQLAAAALAAAPPLPADAAPPYTQTTNALPGVHTRVLDPQGAILIDAALPPSTDPLSILPQLADSAGAPVSAQELLARPEIAAALAGRAATAVRRVALPGSPRVLYAAAPVVEGGAVTGVVYVASPLPATSWEALPPAARWQLAGALALAVLLAAATGTWLARGIARPLAQLAGAARAVAAGDLTQQVPEESPVAELHTLGQAFNGMTAALRQADQAKSAFVADVSHELRTPLTVIKGTLETLQDGAIDDLEARDRFLGSMARETERLIRMVNDLLVLTRADAGALNLQRGALDLADLARARTACLEPLAEARGVQLRVVAFAPAPVRADEGRLAQVLDNLLDNAMRYSPAGGEVSVEVAPAEGGFTCTVRDHGAGIAARHLPFIFDRFYRADAARDRRQGGSGLGLAITRALVLAHGGHIQAHSAEGQGTTVTFWLPAGD